MAVVTASIRKIAIILSFILFTAIILFGLTKLAEWSIKMMAPIS